MHVTVIYDYTKIYLAIIASSNPIERLIAAADETVALSTTESYGPSVNLLMSTSFLLGEKNCEKFF